MNNSDNIFVPTAIGMVMGILLSLSVLAYTDSKPTCTSTVEEALGLVETHKVYVETIKNSEGYVPVYYLDRIASTKARLAVLEYRLEEMECGAEPF